MAGAVGLVLYERSQHVNDRYIKPRKCNIFLSLINTDLNVLTSICLQLPMHALAHISAVWKY